MKNGAMAFYVLQKYYLHGCEALDATKGGHRVGPAPHCEACGNCLGLLEWLPPIEVTFRVCPKGYCDLVFLSSESFFISQRFKYIYEHESLTGLYGFDPVQIVKLKRRKKSQEEPPVYFHVKVVRSRTAVDVEASEIEWEPRLPLCPECRKPKGHALLKRWKRLVINAATWTGEDVFYARGSGELFVSKRFKEVCEKYAVKNAAFCPAEKYFTDFYPSEREGWPLQQFDKVREILGSWNKAGEWDAVLLAMGEVRKQLSEDEKLDWLGLLIDRFPERKYMLLDATSESYYRLTVGCYPPQDVSQLGSKPRG